jgi:hypothetical protein
MLLDVDEHAQQTLLVKAQRCRLGPPVHVVIYIKPD